MLEFESLKQLKAKAVFLSMKNNFDHRYLLILLFLFISSISFNQSVFSQDEEKDPVQLFNQGQDAHEKGDYTTALKLYEEALKIAPEFPEAEFQRGNALQSLGRENEAEKAFQKAIELRENWVLPMVSLGEILVHNKKYSEAETILNKVIELDAQNSLAYLALTEMRLKTKSASEVLKDLLQKLQHFPNPDASIWTARGAIERSLGDISAAKTSFNRAFSLDKKNSFLLSEMIEISLAEKNFEDAVATAQTLVRFYPNSLSSKLLLTRVYAESGNTNEALKILETLDEKNSDVANLRSQILAAGTKDIGLLEKQLENDSKNPLILGRLCSLTRTNPSKALVYCQRASEVEPNNIEHAVGYGAALVQAKQFESAVNLLKKLVPFEPENFAIHSNLATALFELKRFSEAKNEFKWLTEKKPDLAVAYYFLAITHDNLAEYNEALTNYQKFLQIADAKQNSFEIEKVNFRLPILQRQIKQGAGSKKGKNNE